MQNDCCIQQPQVTAGISIAEGKIAECPRRHTHDQHIFNTYAVKQKGNRKNEYTFRYLSKDHFTCGILHAFLNKKRVSKTIIKSKRNTDKYSCNKENEV